MASLNKVMLIGRLGSDPDVRYTPSGTSVAKFNLATSENYTDKDGQRQEKTEWHRITVWGRQAENSGQYLKKGSQVYLEGSLRTNEWEDKDGNKRYTTEVNAQRVVFLSGKRDSQESTGYSGGQGQHDFTPQRNSAPMSEPEIPNDDDLDIPF